MKKSFIFLFILGVFTLFYSCSSEDITCETVIIVDELDPNDPDLETQTIREIPIQIRKRSMDSWLVMEDLREFIPVGITT